MTQENPAQPGERTEEMHAAVRRRALPVAVCGMICALIGIGLSVMRPVTPFTPPDFVGMNLQFCAMLIGAGIFFYAKPTPRTGAAQAFSILAVLLGMGGTVYYTTQTVKLRTMKEQYELNNVTTIAHAAKAYAKSHEGKYPANLLVMLEAGLIKPENLRSPFTMNEFSVLFTDYENRVRGIKAHEELLATVEKATDYLYVGEDLHVAEPAVEKDLLVVVSNTAIMRVSLAICAASGEARFIRSDDVPAVMKACNEARAKIGLGILRPPEVMAKVQAEAATQPR